jgi:protease IV
MIAMNFFKIMFASMLGTLLTIFLISVICIGIIAGIISAASSQVESVSKNTVLHLTLDNTILDREPGMRLFFDLSGPNKSYGLDEIIRNIKKAKEDSNIQGIYLDLSDIPTGITTVGEIREALNDFKSSGKFIYAYSSMLSQKAYYLATVADKVYLNPEGGILFKGINSELMFLKGALEKLDVKVQIVRHGKFKAATEPLFLDKMSPENRKQITELINDVWDGMLLGISESRGISKADLNNIADSLKLSSAADAYAGKLVDSVIFMDQFLGIMRTKLGLAESAVIKTITLDKYMNVPFRDKSLSAKDKIVVIYAQGNVVDGEGDDQSIGGDRFAKAIRKAREDKKVKAIVLRVNSPGGSALASEIVLREVLLANKEKPVVASFGDLAASGGYYIACGARKIYAEPTTLTGSIGVWGAIPNFQGLLTNKLGITFDNAMTNKNSDFISVNKPLPPYQVAVIQKEIEHVYDVFVTHVSEGRNLDKTMVDSIGQGRIWSGTDAKEIGLVDEMGGLTKAIEAAAKLAETKDYRVVAMPEQKDAYQQIMENFFGSKIRSSLQRELGEDYRYYELLKEVRELRGIQARLPFDITLN